MDALTAPGALDLAMTADPAVISRTGMEQFLRGAERHIVARAIALEGR
ncbi:Non-ribosomal peptide synthetase condensation domain protein OS=Streptomyces cyaneofuscatus OX=66883 GN=G3I52_18720 PE=4 SV=1 [Streptomyces cyaneofuscatus]